MSASEKQGLFRSLWKAISGFFYYLSRPLAFGWWLFRSVVVLLVLVLGFLFLFNVLFFATYRDVPARALSSNSVHCRDAISPGWDVLASVDNDEWKAVDADEKWRNKFACTIQRHILPGYVTEAGIEKPLEYDLAFLEFQEDGKPYVLRIECPEKETCDEERGLPVRRQAIGQLEALINHLKANESNYVVAYVHGWRHDASIGDGDVARLRIYAAHAARFIADRAATDPRFEKTRVTAIYVGWRGARTDETWLTRKLSWFGDGLGTASAVLTLFDRKPVSEAIAPSALAALRSVENTLKIDTYRTVPADAPHRMIVFGHSLGGNMLITSLQDHLEKKAASHEPGEYMLPALGDLVVLINPAAEAAKWTSIQRTLWRRMALAYGERRSPDDYAASHTFFRDDQRPIVISATAARNWPPGGRRELDCQVHSILRQAENDEIQAAVEYDWATHDLFPAFKLDLRPLADRLEQLGTRSDPNDECTYRPLTWKDTFDDPLRSGLITISALLRVIPFMQTDPEETRTIGNLDPPRSPEGTIKNYRVTMKPFGGTTHEVRRSINRLHREDRKVDPKRDLREIPIGYTEIRLKEASCWTARHWLTRAREEMKQGANATGWDSFSVIPEQGMSHPALQFTHGCNLGGIAPPTRANDPFWNLRAFDTALAAHDGFMLSSFICAMNQLVLDDITRITPEPAAPPKAQMQ